MTTNTYKVTLEDGSVEFFSAKRDAVRMAKAVAQRTGKEQVVYVAVHVGSEPDAVELVERRSTIRVTA